MAEKLSNLLLERFLLGEVTPQEKTRVEAALNSDPETARRLDALRRETEAFFQAHPEGQVVPGIEARLERAQLSGVEGKKRFPIQAWLIPALTLLLVVGLAPLWMDRGSTDAIVPISPGVPYPEGSRAFAMERYKGGDEIALYRQGAPGSEPERLTNRQSVRPGDRLQLAYTSAGSPQGVLFSVDSAGVLTWHYPAKAPEARAPLPKLVMGKRQFLGDSYELDATAGEERFYLVTCAVSVAPALILGGAARLARSTDAQFPGCVVTVFSVVKRP
ncbi:MAG: hypothetical protein J0L75_14895 [Spirochaetes bacterium]|nr:hypothetical protein [Spirochaetota bacterium]